MFRQWPLSHRLLFSAHSSLSVVRHSQTVITLNDATRDEKWRVLVWNLCMYVRVCVTWAEETISRESLLACAAVWAQSVVTLSVVVALVRPIWALIQVCNTQCTSPAGYSHINHEMIPYLVASWALSWTGSVLYSFDGTNKCKHLYTWGHHRSILERSRIWSFQPCWCR